MGSNSEIKHFKPESVGPIQGTLFGPAPDRAPIIDRLIQTRWVFRGSDLAAGETTLLTHILNEPIAVVLDGTSGDPISFSRIRGSQRRRYAIDRIIQSWVVDRNWHDPAAHEHRLFYRVSCAGGTFDLSNDILASEWFLVAIQD